MNPQPRAKEKWGWQDGLCAPGESLHYFYLQPPIIWLSALQMWPHPRVFASSLSSLMSSQILD